MTPVRIIFLLSVFSQHSAGAYSLKYIVTLSLLCCRINIGAFWRILVTSTFKSHLKFYQSYLDSSW